jgi:hypothetical protein
LAKATFAANRIRTDEPAQHDDSKLDDENSSSHGVEGYILRTTTHRINDARSTTLKTRGV